MRGGGSRRRRVVVTYSTFLFSFSHARVFSKVLDLYTLRSICLCSSFLIIEILARACVPPHLLLLGKLPSTTRADFSVLLLQNVELTSTFHNALILYKHDEYMR